MIFTLLQKIVSVRLVAVIAVSSLFFFACRDGGETQRATPTNNTTTINTPENNTQNIAAPEQQNDNPGASASSEFHYVCANNCEGSGANAAGPCPVCGEELVHNAAFHSGEQGGNNQNAPQIINDDGGSFSSKITPLGEESSSNSAPAVSGDASFHYICSAGCGGGGAAQGPCPSCGAAMEHNAAFHANQGATAAPGASGNQPSGQKYPSVFNTPGAVRSAPAQGGSGGTTHYICSAGCGGGGNAQGTCPSCGAPLAHNDAFHQ